MSTSGKAPTMITFIICLVLYIVAMASHFGVFKLGGDIGDYAWMIGFGLLLLAVQVRGL